MPYKDREQQLAAQHQHYTDNRDVYRARTKTFRRALAEKVNTIKEASPCTDCKKYYRFYVMQFDHVGGSKVAPINRLVRNSTWKSVELEIAKCELVCANCHAERTYLRAAVQGKLF